MVRLVLKSSERLPRHSKPKMPGTPTSCNFNCLALDDIGYVQHDRAEMEVLFALLAERYERKSVMITSNLVFSK